LIKWEWLLEVLGMVADGDGLKCWDINW